MQLLSYCKSITLNGTQRCSYQATAQALRPTSSRCTYEAGTQAIGTTVYPTALISLYLRSRYTGFRLVQGLFAAPIGPCTRASGGIRTRILALTTGALHLVSFRGKCLVPGFQPGSTGAPTKPTHWLCAPEGSRTPIPFGQLILSQPCLPLHHGGK